MSARDERRTADLLVIGAGPAGTAAAIVAARCGRSVVVIDKATFPRDKCCGDGLTTLALRELVPLGLRPTMVPSWQNVEAAWLRSPSGREVCLPMPSGGVFAATTPRAELDAALVDLAREAGADVREAVSVRTIEEGDDRLCVGVDTAEGPDTIQARHVIAADGMWSPTRRLLEVGESGYRGEWHAARQYARHVTGPAAQRLYVWFEADLLPGYAWSFPLPGGRVNLGFGVPRDDVRHGAELAALWTSLWSRPHIAAALGETVELEGRSTAWPIPAGIDRAVLSHGRVLFVGDAARATDVMTGEGIGQAVLTGRLAAEAVCNGGDHDAVARHYERAVRRELFADHRMSAVLGAMLSRPLLARGAVRLAGSTAWTRRNFVRWMFEDEPRAVVFTPRRWHRRFLRRPAPVL
ncbi:MAG: NAD(P)/FAD-dependent oxidoreductase [Ilumatobacteraceae bacterium]